MSLLRNIFTSTTENSEPMIHWIPLTSLQQLEEIKEISNTETVVIFKHSTRCGTSSMVKRRFEKSFDDRFKDVKMYYLDLLSYREVSNEIAYTFQVQHQSPQLLVIKGGEVVAHASHYDIMSIDLATFL